MILVNKNNLPINNENGGTPASVKKINKNNKEINILFLKYPLNIEMFSIHTFFFFKNNCNNKLNNVNKLKLYRNI